MEKLSGSFFVWSVEQVSTMALATSQADERLAPLPDELDSPRAKLVYLALAITDRATISELQETLDVPKLTLLSVLDALAGRGLVERTDDGYVAVA